MTYETWHELVERTPVTVPYPPAGSTTIELGRLRAHAVAAGSNTAACRTDRFRLLPGGHPWTQALPEHVQRCQACLAIRPLGEPA